MEADTFGVGLAHQAKANSLQLTNLEVMLNDYELDSTTCTTRATIRNLLNNISWRASEW
jgi:hypothetical protein